jgi:hypothetical protein
MTAYPVSGPAFVRIEMQMGHVEVVAEPRDDVDVRISPANSARSGDRSAAEAVRVTHTGKEVSVVGPFRLNLFGPGDQVDVVVRVPEASDASVSLKYGSMHLAGTLGTVRVALDYGDASVARVGRADLGLGHGELRVESISGDADVTVKSGRARIGHVNGALRLKGSDAGIDIGTIVGAADIATSSGIVQLGDPGPAVTVRSAYGPVRIRELSRGTARIEGSYGALTLGVRGGTAVWLDASSRHGVVRNELSADRGPADGEGTLEIHARTGYGDITVHRVPAGAAAGA